jgi:hypothetical protein
MTELPTNWITAESLATFAGMVTAVFIGMLTIDVVGIPAEYQKVLGLSAALLLNVIAVVFTPPVVAVNVVLSVINGFLTFLVAYGIFLAAAPLRDRYRKV